MLGSRIVGASLFSFAILGCALALPAVANAQGWNDGGRDGYEENRSGYGGRGGYRENGGGYGDRRGYAGSRRGDDDRGRQGHGYGEREWDGDHRREWDGYGWPGWGGGYGPHGPAPAGQRWWRGQWWAQGAGPCWRWSPWRQSWKWVCP